jgi:hypothetical protein
MTTLRKLALSALLSVSAFSAVTMTSCTKDKTCTTGLSGSDCKTEVRASYFNSYKGSGSDNDTPPNTYTNWTAKFTTLGTDPTKMNMQMLDANLLPIELFTVTLTTNTTFTIDSKVSGTSTFSGTGTTSGTSLSLSITEVDASVTPSKTYITTFTSMVKQ